MQAGDGERMINYEWPNMIQKDSPMMLFFAIASSVKGKNSIFQKERKVMKRRSPIFKENTAGVVDACQNNFYYYDV